MNEFSSQKEEQPMGESMLKMCRWPLPVVSITQWQSLTVWHQPWWIDPVWETMGTVFICIVSHMKMASGRGDGRGVGLSGDKHKTFI